MKIHKVHLAELQNEEYFKLFKQFWSLVREYGADTLKITEAFVIFAVLVDEIDKVLEQIRKSVLTKTLAELDANRDMIFMGIRDYVSAFLHSPFAAKREVAEKLQIVLDKYQGSEKQNYGKESALIYNLIQELTQNYAADLTALNMSDWLTELDKANKAFDNKWLERNDDKAENHLDENMLDLRRKGNPMYYELVEMLEAFSIAYKNEPVFAEFIRKWNEIVDSWKQVLAIRKGRANADKEENEQAN